MASACLLCFLLLDFLLREYKSATPGNKTIIWLGVMLVLLSFFVSAIIIMPESDSHVVGKFAKGLTLKHLKQIFGGVYNAFIPLPRLKYSFWDKNLIPDRTIRALLSLPLLTFIAMVLTRKKLILMLFFLFTVSALGFQYFVHIGYIRHSGHYFIMFIVCLWLSRYYKEDIQLKSVRLINWADFGEKHREGFLYVLLTVQLVAGLFASGMDWFCTFSSAKDTAKYIKENHLDNLPIWGYGSTSAIAGYLGKSIYYPRINRIGSFVCYSFNEEDIDEPNLVKRAKLYTENEKTDIVLVINYRLNKSDPSIMKLAEFDKTIAPNEIFYVYLIKHTCISN